MAHPRTQIRQATIAALDGATAAGARVHDTRVDPFRKGDLPALSVYTLSESSDKASGGLDREVQLEIAGWVSGADAAAVARAMDDLAVQIEDAMAADAGLRGTASDSVLTGTEPQIRAEDGKSDPLVGIITLTYTVTYQTTLGLTVAVDDFLRVNATHRPVGAVEANQASDSFAVREAP